MSKKMDNFWSFEELMNGYRAVRDINGNPPQDDDVDSEMADDLNGIDLKEIIADIEKEAGQGFDPSTVCSGNEEVSSAAVAVTVAESSSDGSNRATVPVLVISESEDETTPLASGTWSEDEEAIAAHQLVEFSKNAFKQKQGVYEYAALENQCQKITILNDSSLFSIDYTHKSCHKMLKILRSMKNPPESTMQLAELVFLENLRKREMAVEKALKALENAKNELLTVASLSPESERSLTKLKRGVSGGGLQRILETDEGPLRYGCNVCTKSYSRAADLYRHIKMVHKN